MSHLLEPGIAFTARTTWSLRPAYAYVWHPTAARFGIAVGFGPTLWLRGSDLFTSAGPEASLRFGRCCRPMYLALGLRYDVALAANPEHTFLVKLGFVYR